MEGKDMSAKRKKDIEEKYKIDEMRKQFQKEYREYLQKEGLDESVCIGQGGKYPAEFWNVQIHDLKTDFKRRCNA